MQVSKHTILNNYNRKQFQTDSIQVLLQHSLCVYRWTLPRNWKMRSVEERGSGRYEWKPLATSTLLTPPWFTVLIFGYASVPLRDKSAWRTESSVVERQWSGNITIRLRSTQVYTQHPRGYRHQPNEFFQSVSSQYHGYYWISGRGGDR